MKTTSTILVLGANLVLSCAVSAQVFDCGSSGAMGNVVVTTNEVWDMPDDGQFHLNSLVVEAGATLTFHKQPNGLNRPVYLLALSNVTILGRISVDGQPGQLSGLAGEGGPGGFNGGGFGIYPAILPGNGHGPGRGEVEPNHYGQFGQGGSFGTDRLNRILQSGVTYGNLLLIPLIGGSGGAGNWAAQNASGASGASGGGGGGAILVASDTQLQLEGTIQARGGDGHNASWSGAGSGGAIRLVAPLVVGNGTNDVSGGNGYTDNRGNLCIGGDGRVRIDCKPQGITLVTVGRHGAPPWTIGRNPLISFPATPQLAIIHAAGVEIPEGTNAAVVITMPVPSLQEQTVRLQARNFTNEFKVYVETTPQNGHSKRTDFLWNVGTNKLATNDVMVNLLGNTTNRITAWAELSF